MNRPRNTKPAAIALLIACVATAGTMAQEIGADEADPAARWRWPSAATRTALSYIRMLPGDLALRSDYVPRDACRLPTVNRIMVNPPGGVDFLQDVAEMLFGVPGRSTRDTLDLQRLAEFALGEDLQSESAYVSVDSTFVETRGLSGLAPEWRQYLKIALTACADIGWGDSVLSGLDSTQRDLVWNEIPDLLLEDPGDMSKPEEVLDSIQAVEDSLASEFAVLVESIDWRWIVSRGTSVLDRLIASVPEGAPSAVDGSAFGDSVRMIETPSGLVMLGTPGDDVFSLDASIVIDPGGNDQYRMPPRPPGLPRLIVDWSGDDDYRALAGRDLGTGYWSWGCLIDREGDDTYRAGNFSIGAGWFGAGALLDLAGRDLYIGDTYTQGAGGFGVGLLFDSGREGDLYSGRLFAQGFGFSAGTGILADAGGNDSYTAGGLYGDVLRYEDHHLSLSQGFGYGIRPHFSGGVGLLLDAGGNDVYVADIFAQACSYWWSFGGLWDAGGNDQYIAYQYAQGSATHMTAGCLLDLAGNDTYSSKGVSQGCGHDWAAGILVDGAGDDRYTATDLSQAAGSANGVGILIDEEGDDAYGVVSLTNTQGYGNPRREYGSIGLFLDLAGQDRYDGPGRDATAWLGRSLWGVGVDADSAWHRVSEAGENEIR